MQTPARIGLLGGSFDPVHRAHIALALAALDALTLDHVRLLPAANPWQRAPLAASAEHRLRMLQLATAPHLGLQVDPIEIERGGKTYTIDTIDTLSRRAPDAYYVWILGSDQLQNFCTWQRWQDIVLRVDLAVALRPDTTLQTPPALSQHLHALGRTLAVIPLPSIEISASRIRHHLAHGLPVHDWLDPNVLDYIVRHHLYHPLALSSGTHTP